jgi:hypothetical protein
LRIDLKAILPVWAQYAVAVVVAGSVMMLAWYVGHDRPTGVWVTERFIPVWQWVGLALLVAVVVVKVVNRRRR